MSRFIADILADLDEQAFKGSGFQFNALCAEAATTIRELITQRDVTGTKRMKHFQEAGNMELSLEQLFQRLEKGAELSDKLASVLDNDTDEQYERQQDAKCLRSAAFLIRAGIIGSNEIEQRCGKALGYPWYKDDQKNFPGTTDADGVCVGEHVAETIVAELCSRYKSVKTQLDAANLGLA